MSDLRSARLTLPLFAALLSLQTTACRKSEPPARDEVTTAQAELAAPQPSDGDAPVGVTGGSASAVCDDFLERVGRCVEAMPEAGRAALRDAMTTQVAQLRKTLNDGPALAQACQTLLQSSKSGLAAVCPGVSFDSPGAAAGPAGQPALAEAAPAPVAPEPPVVEAPPAAPPASVEPPKPPEPPKPSDPFPNAPVDLCPESPDPALTPIVGWDGMCLRSGRGAVMRWVREAIETTDSTSDGDNPLSALIPTFSAEEREGFDASTRAALAAKARATEYWVEPSCSIEAVSAANRLSIDCGLGSVYIGAAPSVKRTQSCEWMEGSSCGECEDHGDCSGFFCGCPQSRCTIFGVCTGCPGERVCDAPEFEVSEPRYRTSISAKGDIEAMTRGELLMLVRVGSAWRKVTSRSPTWEEIEMEEHKRGERVEEHDSGAYFSLSVLWAGVVIGDEVGAVVKASPWRGKSPDYTGQPLEISCNATRCAACAGEGCRPPAPAP